jgi:hypothetical protein
MMGVVKAAPHGARIRSALPASNSRSPLISPTRTSRDVILLSWATAPPIRGVWPRIMSATFAIEGNEQFGGVAQAAPAPRRSRAVPLPRRAVPLPRRAVPLPRRAAPLPRRASPGRPCLSRTPVPLPGVRAQS